MRVIIGGECSGMIRRAFAARGHFVVSVDLKPAEDGPSKWGTADYSTGWHYQGDLIDFIYGDAGGLMDAGFDLGIFHPECTYLCNSGVKWLYKDGQKKNGIDNDRWDNMRAASTFFGRCAMAPIAKIAIENPIMHCWAAEKQPPYSQIIQPWMFGHKEMKATCLWLKKLPPLMPTNVVGPPPKDVIERREWAKVHQMAPGPNRSADRARTLQGIADAMATQWGGA